MYLKQQSKVLSFCLLIFLVSCTKKDNITNPDSTSISKELVFRSVSEKEYQEATPFNKRLIDKIDASVNSLNIIGKNSPVQYEATFIISLDENKILNNSLVISPIESSQSSTNRQIKSFAESAPDGKCHICGVSSAYSCIKEVETYMDKNHKNEIDVHVTRSSDGCVDITYK